MIVREYLKDTNPNHNITFIKAVARKDENTPFYHEEYQTTPIRCISEFQNSPVMDFYILNDKQCPIDWKSGAQWRHRFESGDLISMLVISKENLEKLYSPKQAAEMVEFIGKEIENGF